MSGLLEIIARRRRASAGRRLGPRSMNGLVSFEANGAAPEDTVVAEPKDTAVASPELDVVAAPEIPEPEVTVLPDPAPAPEPPPAPEPEPPAPAPEPPPAPDPAPPAPAPEPPPTPEPEPPAPAPEPPPTPEPEPTPVPTDSEPAEPASAPPGFVERGRMRRRARYLRQLREVQLRDIGGFLLESGRQDRPRPDLLGPKLAAAAETERELYALEQALEERRSMAELRVAGIGGACETCGALFGSSDRFCSACGKRL